MISLIRRQMRGVSLALGCFLLAALSCARAEEPSPIVILVNADNPVSSIKKSELADLYLKKKRKWENGELVRFVERAAGSAERKKFLDVVLGKSESDIDVYWIGQKLYAGDSAPQRVENERGTMQFVSAFPGAISYGLSSMAVKDPKVKVINLLTSE